MEASSRSYPDPYQPRDLWYFWYGYRWIRWAAVLIAIAAIALLGWLLLVKPGGANATSSVSPGGGPVAATEQQLVGLSRELHHHVYWAGIVPGTKLELTETSHHYPYVRYLTEETKIGDPSPDFLTVGTYPAVNAFADLQRYARSSRSRVFHIDDGGIAVTVPGSPTSVYFAYPHDDVQVEVYDPGAKQALHLVRSGAIRPVGEQPPGT